MNEVTWSDQGNTPLLVWGPGQDVNQPPGTADLTSLVANAFATNTHIRRDLVEHLPGGGIRFQTAVIQNEGVVYQNNGVIATAFLVDHGIVKPLLDIGSITRVTQSRFRDTTASSNLVNYAQGTDVFVHEVLLSPAGATTSNDVILGYHPTPE